MRGSELTSVPTVTKKNDSIHLEVCSVTSPESPSRKPVWEDHQELKNENGWWLEEPGLLTRSSVKVSRMQAIIAKCYCFLWWTLLLELFTSNATLKHTEALNFHLHTPQGQWSGAAQSSCRLRQPRAVSPSVKRGHLRRLPYRTTARVDWPLSSPQNVVWDSNHSELDSTSY